MSRPGWDGRTTMAGLSCSSSPVTPEEKWDGLSLMHFSFKFSHLIPHCSQVFWTSEVPLDMRTWVPWPAGTGQGFLTFISVSLALVLYHTLTTGFPGMR